MNMWVCVKRVKKKKVPSTVSFFIRFVLAAFFMCSRHVTFRNNSGSARIEEKEKNYRHKMRTRKVECNVIFFKWMLIYILKRSCFIFLAFLATFNYYCVSHVVVYVAQHKFLFWNKQQIQLHVVGHISFHSYFIMQTLPLFNTKRECGARIFWKGAKAEKDVERKWLMWKQIECWFKVKRENSQ
jgi:hypothetical protein